MTSSTIPARSVSGSSAAPLPRAIRRALGRLGRRVRLAGALRGLGLLMRLAALVAAPGMAADFLWVVPQGARWAIWGGGLAVVTLVVLFRVVGPLVRPLGAFDLAAVAERGDPRLGERLTGAVALLGTTATGSPALIAALADDAAARAATVDPRRAVAVGRAARGFALGALALAVVAAPGLVSGPYRTLGRRFLAPWRDLDRVGRFVVAVTPGDRVVAIGSDLALTAEVTPRFGSPLAPETAWLEWTDATTHRAAMPSEDSAGAGSRRSFALTLPRVAGSFTYRVVSGSAVSARHTITAVAPPAVASVAARVAPPAYSRIEPHAARDPARIEALEGGRITLTVAAHSPVRSIAVEWPAAPARDRKATRRTRALELAADRRSGTVTLPAEESGPYALTLRDDHGLTSRPEPPRRLLVLPDRPPVVAVRGPADLKESRPDDTARLAVAARDDIAVASVALHYTIERPNSAPESGHVAVAPAGLGTKAARGEAALELGPLGLKPGDSVSYRVRVADNRPEPRGPNVVWSAAQMLHIVADAEPMLARRGAAARADLQAQLDALKKDAATNRHETEQLRYAADAAQRGNGVWDQPRQQALGHREAEARAVEDRLQLFARALDADGRFRPLARPARQIADVEAEAARDRLDQARRAAGPAERLGELRQADARLAAVSERLDDLQRQFNALAQRDADNQRLNDLAHREEALADKAENAEADRARLDQLQAEQDAVRRDLDALLKQSPALRADVLAAQAAEADDLARRARALADRQRVEARQATDLSKHAAALKALADDQRALEDDARRLALDVDQPLAENDRGRLNTAAVREAVAPLERGDLDQARQRLEGAEAELRRLARDLDDVPDDPKALARRLLHRQDALNGQVAEATAEFRGKNDLTPEDKAEMAAKLKPLAARQEGIAQLAAALADPDQFPAAKAQSKSERPNPKFPEEAAQNAARKTANAREGLRTPLKPRDIEARQNEARQMLARLADALPDHGRRQEPTRQALNEAHRLAREADHDLDRHLRETARAPRDLANRLEPVAQKQAKVAEALAHLPVDAAAEPQRARAADRARALAEAIQAARDQPAGREALPDLQARARASLDRLEQKLNNQQPADDLAAELAAEQRDQAARVAPPEDRPADQRRIAAALHAMQAPDAARPLAEAVRRAEAAARAPGDPQAIKDAAEALAALARDFGNGPAPPPAAKHPDDPDLGLTPGQPARARDLARRERQLRERLQALLGDRVGPQRDLRRDADALGKELADLRDRARPLSDRPQGPANDAANLIGEQAPRAMDQGADHLAQARPAPARDEQRRAAELLERGAHSIDDLAAALRADAPADAPGAAEPPTPGPLGAAREALAKAANDLSQAREPGPAAPPAMQAAGQAMRHAAQGMRAAARNAAEPPGTDATAQADADADAAVKDPHSTPAGTAVADLAELKDLVRRKTGRAWGELPGHLRTEILQMSRGRYRDDYARLIQLYFRQIAAGTDREPIK